MRNRLPDLVLLPGMDGTGRLFQDYVGHLLQSEPTLKVHVIDYPPDRILGYQELKDLIKRRLPQDSDFFLLGESFSGPLAIELAGDFAIEHPQHLQGLILCATFHKNPQALLAPFSGLTRLFAPQHIPRALINWMMFDSHAKPSHQEALYRSLELVDEKVMQHRCREVLQVNVTDKLSAITCPVLYLQAQSDRLIPAHHGRAIQKLIPQTQLIRFTSGHMLLQTQAKLASDATLAFMRQSVKPSSASINSN
ncbi:alpha/beta hydrolase [Undibacterium cyanobacteriorum]|uniref:Alpha/beta hydrolase n=1 Tax=Undibacterium cyanobacteriorum TaxID=3073561 RepID=A0ABY9RH76_9BURK|nr:alpha/beta hydrolase [Undibacterium sp. 20NA77.5]WMW80573.1 alpha/beta hydrolase [Undibacterium sp. 20NA77.5]